MTVIHGKLLPGVNGRRLDTFDDFWNLIQTKCIQDCPTTGAHFCDIEYATSPENGLVYSAHLYIDDDSRFVGEEFIYRIENLRIVPCVGLIFATSNMQRMKKVASCIRRL